MLIISSEWRSCRHLIRGKRVLELGAGLGMTSIAASLLGASRVIITDGDDELLRGKTTENVTLNLGEIPLKDGRIQVARLYWYVGEPL